MNNTDRIAEIRARIDAAVPEVMRVRREMLDVCAMDFSDRDAAWFHTWIAEWFNTIVEHWQFEDALYLLDRLAKAEAKNKTLQAELIQLAQESVRRDAVLAKMEADVMQLKYFLSCDPDDLLATRRWIPVAEDLPPYGENVLALHDGVVYVAGMDEVNVFTKQFTHWMPFPEPPEEGE